MKKETGRLDWDGARARLERIQSLIDRTENPPVEELQRLYSLRAERLAKPEERLGTLQMADELIVFRLGAGRYAFRISEVTEVLAEYKLAPAPGAPPSVAGVIQVRGEIRPVYDLRRQLGITGESKPSAGILVLLRAGSGQSGVCVDSVEDIRSVMKDDRRLAGQAAHVLWMTEDLVSVLNTESLWKREI